MRIPFTAFLMTHRGRLVERRMEMARDKVMSVGISISALGSFEHLRPHIPVAAAAVEQRPVEGGDQQAAAGSSGQQQQQLASKEGELDGEHSDEEAGGAVVAEFQSSEFRLLLREIRAEGRAGEYSEQ